MLQFPDQDPYQDLCPQVFNADALFHVLVSVKRIFLFGPYFKVSAYFYYHLKGNITFFTSCNK